MSGRGAWALMPFRLAESAKVEHQAAMVALGRPGVGEDLLRRYGFVDVERVDVPFAWEFSDPEMYARALASTDPRLTPVLPTCRIFVMRATATHRSSR